MKAQEIMEDVDQNSRYFQTNHLRLIHQAMLETIVLFPEADIDEDDEPKELVFEKKLQISLQQASEGKTNFLFETLMTLMQNGRGSVEVNFTDEFKQRLRTLSKKYRHIKSDIQPIIEQLQAGDCLGDQIPGTGYTVFKVRVRNSDIQKGKSGGYRLIYQLESPTSVILLLIYSKLDQTDVAAEEIQLVIEKFQEYEE